MTGDQALFYTDLAMTHINEKQGDLKKYFAYGFEYDRVAYRIAYTINDNDEIVIVVLAGSHENFYKELKKIVNQ